MDDDLQASPSLKNMLGAVYQKFRYFLHIVDVNLINIEFDILSVCYPTRIR